MSICLLYECRISSTCLTHGLVLFLQKNVADSNSIQEAVDEKDKEIRELTRKVDMLSMELAQKESSRENTQKELLTTGRENVVSIIFFFTYYLIPLLFSLVGEVHSPIVSGIVPHIPQIYQWLLPSLCQNTKGLSGNKPLAYSDAFKYWHGIGLRLGCE